MDAYPIMGRSKLNERCIFSSVFKLAFLRREHVLSAVGQGRYALNDIDRAFAVMFHDDL